MTIERQLFKVRRVGRTAEQVLHAPSAASGYYSMDYNEKTGEIRYYPVRIKA